jgi:hypothetical protein
MSVAYLHRQVCYHWVLPTTNSTCEQSHKKSRQLVCNEEKKKFKRRIVPMFRVTDMNMLVDTDTVAAQKGLPMNKRSHLHSHNKVSPILKIRVLNMPRKICLRQKLQSLLSPKSPKKSLKLSRVGCELLLPTSSLPPKQRLSSSSSSSPSVMDFLSRTCADDVVPLILAFAGPQATRALSQVNRQWLSITGEERTWRVLCQELHKVRCEEFVTQAAYKL